MVCYSALLSALGNLKSKAYSIKNRMKHTLSFVSLPAFRLSAPVAPIVVMLHSECLESIWNAASLALQANKLFLCSNL